VSCTEYTLRSLQATRSSGLASRLMSMEPGPWVPRPTQLQAVSASQRPDGLWGPLGYYPTGTGVEPQRREADHSPPSSAEVKNGGAIPPLPYVSSWRSAYLINLYLFLGSLFCYFMTHQLLKLCSTD
jgi:hypothetical protein